MSACSWLPLAWAMPARTRSVNSRSSPGTLSARLTGSPPARRCNDPQHSLLATGQVADLVLHEPGDVQPPPARLITRLNPRIARSREPSVERADQDLDRGLQRIQTLGPGPQPGKRDAHDHNSRSRRGGSSSRAGTPKGRVPAGCRGSSPQRDTPASASRSNRTAQARLQRPVVTIATPTRTTITSDTHSPR